MKMKKEIEIDLETMVGEMLMTEQTLSFEFDGNGDDQPWLLLINGATPDDEGDGGVYRGESIYAAACLAYNSIVGA